MKKTQLWTVLFAFLFGQLIQLVTNAMAHYLYVSDPVTMCITVGIVTVALVVLTAVFTLMPPQEDYDPAHTRRQKNDKIADIIPPIFMDKRAPLDTDPIDIDEEDESVRKENRHVADARKAH